jgi:8-oxo-dGTP pyrophosphatase MutT (NUDIX family)
LSIQRESGKMIDASRRRNLVFISYSHQDRRWLDEFLVSLKQYTRLDLIQTWDDSKIPSGANWKEEIEDALASAKVAVLLVSPHFLASDYIANKEIPPLLRAAKDEGLIILWVAVSASAWRRTPITNYLAANDPERPIKSLTQANRDKEWLKICEKILTAAKSENEVVDIQKSENEVVDIQKNEAQGMLLLAGYVFVEQDDREIILIRGNARLPITKVIKPQESDIEQSINEAVLALFKELGISASQLVEAGFSRPFYCRVYKNPTLEMRPCVFFKIGLNKTIEGIGSFWEENGYRWESKQRIVELWSRGDFWFGRDDECESLLPGIEDPYKAIIVDRVGFELGLKVLECADILIFRENQDGEIEFLVIQRRKKPGWEYPKGGWEYPKGGLYYHETPVEGALREAAEETGIKNKYLRYCGYLGWQTADVRDRDKYYDTIRVHGLTFYYSGNPAEIELDDSHIAYAWQSFNDAKDSLWIPYGAEFFNRWKDKQHEILHTAGLVYDQS